MKRGGLRSDLIGILKKTLTLELGHANVRSASSQLWNMIDLCAGFAAKYMMIWYRRFAVAALESNISGHTHLESDMTTWLNIRNSPAGTFT